MKFPTLLECLTSKRSGVEALAKRAIQPNFDMLQEKWRHESVLAIEFYSQPLALWMFIPCGEDGEPLTKPDLWDDWFDGALYPVLPDNLGAEIGDVNAQEFHNYQAAEQRVLFEGWKASKMPSAMDVGVNVVNDNNHTGFVFRDGKMSVMDPARNIDHFVNRYPWLTPTQSSINQLNLK